MNLLPGEQEAIDATIKAGEQYGYGNLIHELKTAWAKMLVAKWKMDPACAAFAAGMCSEDVREFVKSHNGTYASNFGSTVNAK